ncbi:amino acid permease-domain-containing protein [Thermothelomyces heterothallicus CBS 202.75]|uniref:amino acid permease-domain-containing protein n=1 Tax=Thermothelomyces heterothallicus CBS 202.75 TaxID=1149848 RepID=UPI0037433F4E
MNFPVEGDEETPLLRSTTSPRELSSAPRYDDDDDEEDDDTLSPTKTAGLVLAPPPGVGQAPGRSVEDDVVPETAVLGRNLGWSSAYILIVSRVIGSGIFATPGAIFGAVGSVGLSLLLWLAGALVSWCALVVALEYGCMLPRSGGQKVYLEFTYRRPRLLASFLVAAHALLLGFTASNCIVFGEYLLFALGKREEGPSGTAAAAAAAAAGEEGAAAGRPVQVRLLAIGLMTAITVLHGGFMRAGIAVQNVLGWVKIGLVLLMTVSAGVVVVTRYAPGEPSAVVPGGGGGLDSSEFGPRAFPTTWDGFWEGSVWNWSIISAALFKVFYSYAGLASVNNVMNEVRDPVRTLRSAAPTALVTACVLYLLTNVAYFSVVPLDEIKHGGELVAALFFERVFGQNLGRHLLPLAVAVSAAGNVMVVTFALARLNQEIARQGIIPFGEALSSSRPFGSPLGGLILHYIPSVIVISIPYKDIYSFILEVEGYPGQFFSLATAAGLIRLRWTRPDLKRPYKAFLPAAWFSAALSIALLCAPFIPYNGESWGAHLSRVSYALVGISVLAFGVMYWAVVTILLPWWGNYRLEERADVLRDGTTITKLVHVPLV